MYQPLSRVELPRLSKSFFPLPEKETYDSFDNLATSPCFVYIFSTPFSESYDPHLECSVSMDVALIFCVILPICFAPYLSFHCSCLIHLFFFLSHTYSYIMWLTSSSSRPTLPVLVSGSWSDQRITARPTAHGSTLLRQLAIVTMSSVWLHLMRSPGMMMLSALMSILTSYHWKMERLVANYYLLIDLWHVSR